MCKWYNYSPQFKFPGFCAAREAVNMKVCKQDKWHIKNVNKKKFKDKIPCQHDIYIYIVYIYIVYIYIYIYIYILYIYIYIYYKW